MRPADAFADRRRRRRRRAVLPLVLLQILLASAYADALPIFEGPDAEGHLSCIAAWQAAPLGRPALDARTAAVSHELVQQPPLYYLAAAIFLEPGQAERLADRFSANPYYPGLSHRVSLPAVQAAAAREPGGRIAVWWSLLGAVLCTVATFVLARLLPLGRPGVALLAAAIVALNPQFLHSAASVSNDAWAAGLAALSVALALQTRRRLRRGPAGPGDHRLWAAALCWGLALGGALGAAALTKYSALVLGPAVLLVLSEARPRRGVRSAGVPLAALAATAFGSALVAGPWYLANLRASGQLVPLAAMKRLLPQLFRAEPLGWVSSLYDALWAGRSYWGVFGHGYLAPDGYFLVLHAFLLLALLGWLRAVRPGSGRLRAGVRGWLGRIGLGATLGLCLWPLLTTFAFLRWIRAVQFANQGRLLFGMAPAIALALAWGWASLERPGGRRLLPLGIALWAGLGLSQLLTLQVAFQPPPALAAARPRLPLDVALGDGLQLLGLDLERPVAEGGGELRLRLYWRATRAIAEEAMLYVHAVDARGRKLAAEDRVPLAGRHPTTGWRPGEVFAEDWVLPVERVTEATVLDLVLGAYRDEDPAARLPIRDAQGRELGTELRLARLLARPEGSADPPCPPGARTAAGARWQAGMVLRSWDLRRGPDGWPGEVALCWSAAAAPWRDRSLFVHVLDGRGTIVAQWDGLPQGGARPLATWERGSIVQDRIRLQRPQGLAPDAWDRLAIGWYDPLTGAREPLADGADRWTLPLR